MAKQKPEKEESLLRSVIEFVVLIVVVVLATQLLTRFVVSKDVVQGNSMQPTLEDGDRLYSLRHKSVSRNDIVVIDAPDAPGELYIKRVIGMPGDTVQVKNEKLYVNGKQQKQPYLKQAFMTAEIKTEAAKADRDPSTIPFTYNFSLKTLTSTKRATVPKNSYFVMGDNRLISHDGRDFGFIKKDKVQSVVVWRYWPLTKMTIY
ncbi:signal peptidase I [Lacticaseibacillus parakribbianus]|uniref:signal peptidase I n=1 Tax=Lacticaseibacillus parakribbianus TaxID=2970927 RepID=UPI0021CB2647|nr:signal peptidase I [Lacticaseibacillus parakribbianus]